MGEFLGSLWGFFVSHRQEIATQTLEHLGLTLVALTLATLVGLVIGIGLTRYRQMSGNVIGIVSAIQTIPSIALLGFLLPVLGIGVVPAIVALFLYALLPIVQNTFTGIDGVNPTVKEAAKGLGMPDGQVLFKIELPLAVPVIFAGIRTATVTTVGVATLCALVAAGGLGEFIFRGISLNNPEMLLAGAIPAAGLALLLDFLLGKLQHNIQTLFKPILIGALGLVVLSGWFVMSVVFSSPGFTAGFPAEFVERADGYRGLVTRYNLPAFDTVELESGLAFQALKEKKVDLISGDSTDGRIQAYDLVILKDDQNYFPPYYAAPLIRNQTLRKYPEIQPILAKLVGKISDQEMADLNYQVDQLQQSPNQVAQTFLTQLGLKTSTARQGKPDILIGGKKFTEQYILAELITILIENYTGLNVESKTGLGGTKIAFEALIKGEIDLYPEYTGTGFLVILKPDEKTQKAIISDKDQVLDYVRQQSNKIYDLSWLEPFGFNNTYALMMRKEDAERLNISSITDLKRYLENR